MEVSGSAISKREGGTPLAPAAQSVSLLTAVSAAVICTVLSVAFALADAILLFGTHLPEYLPIAVAMTLASVTVLVLIVTFLSKFNGCIAGAQEVTVVILAAMIASITGAMREIAGQSEESILATSVACLIVATLFVGICFWLAGHSKIGRFVRYLPYAVTCGFLGGAGVMMVLFAIQIASGVNVFASGFTELLSVDVMWKVGLTALLAFVIFRVTSIRAPQYALPLLLLTSVGCFLAFVVFKGSGIKPWAEAGWMLSTSTERTQYPPITFSQLYLINWHQIAMQIPKMIILVGVSMIALLIKINAMEIMLSNEVDQDRELKITGLANIGAGASGAICGFHSIGVTQVTKKMGATSRLTGFITAGLCALALFFSGQFLIYMPRFVFAAIVLWIGADLIKSSIIHPLQSLRRHESVTIIAVVLSVVFLGFLEGVAIGLIAAVFLFAVDYSKINVIRQSYDGTQLRSSMDRKANELAYLQKKGDEILILRLHGYLFFGTSHRLIEQLKEKLAEETGYRKNFLLIDMDKVTAIDASAETLLTKLLGVAKSHQLEIFISAQNRDIVGALQTALAHQGTGSTQPLSFYDSMDQALEHYEQLQLKTLEGDNSSRKDIKLQHWIGSNMSSKEYEQFASYLTRNTLNTGDVLVHQGKPADLLHFVVNGELDVFVESAGKPPVRVRKMIAGSLVGEVSFYLNQMATATVKAAGPCEVLSLSKNNIEELLRSQSGIAAIFHRNMATQIAGRLSDNGRLIRVLAES